jgi:hypothetical protein
MNYGQVFRQIINMRFSLNSYALGVRKLINAHHWAGYPKKAKKINVNTHMVSFYNKQYSHINKCLYG